MRIGNRGVERSGESIEFTFEGRPVRAWAGESLAAALISADVWSLRETRGGARRGLFCGMGICGECAVTVDGVQRRACLEPVRGGADVRRTRRLATPRVVPPGAGPAEDLTPDVMILGAGPAGLAAARIAGEAGLDVLLVDERAKAGGQFYKQPGEGFTVDGGAIDRQFAEGRKLIAAAEGAGVSFLFGATLWSAGPGPAFRVACEGRSISIAPRRAILCPGAYERPHPVPGWTLPGVMTTGAAQTLLRAYQTAPGRRILVAGNGPLNLQVARELVRAGATVVALAELAQPPWRASPADLLRMATSAPRLVLEGIGHLAALRGAGVTPAYRHVLTRAEGDEQVRRAFVARIDGMGRILSGSERGFEVDSVCMGYGFLPQAEIARAIGCAHRADPATAGLVAVRDEFGRSSVAEIFIAGDAGGLGGARIAEAQGTLAGIAVSKDLGAPVGVAAARAMTRARETVRRHRGFQAALWRVHAAPALDPALFEKGLLCRCEEIDRGTAAEHLSTGLASLGAVKRASRLGMGPCQGRYCGALLARMLAEQTGDPTEPDAFFAPRTPFKPIQIATLTTASNVSSQCEL